MTGAMNALVATTPFCSEASAILADVKAGANAIANINFQSSGGMTYAGSGSSGPTYWCGPTVGVVPPLCYVTVSVTSGSAPTTNPGTLIKTDGTGGTPLWQWTQTVVGTMSATGIARVYSDAAGTNQVGRMDFTVSAQRTS